MDLKDSQMLATINGNIIDKFTSAGFNPNYYYPREKILSRLDAIAISKFDRDAAEQIFDQCPQKNLGDVTINDFASQYSNGVIICRKKIENLKRDIEDQKNKLNVFRMRTEEVKEKDKNLGEGRELLTLIEKY